MPTRFLLLGADGFVGTHVHDRLDELPDTTVVTAARRGDVHPDLQLDLTAPVDEVSRALRDVAPDVVVNCAGALTGEPAALAANNLVTVANLVDALFGAGRRIRLVHVGSIAEYGRVPAGTPLGEDTPERPVDVYGLTKLAGTRLVRTAAAAGLDAIVLRVATSIGPAAPATSLAGRVVAQLRQMEVTGGGGVTTGPLDDVRDFVDVRDVADAVVAAAVRPETAHPETPRPETGPTVLNIGSGLATPVRGMVDELLTLAGFTGGLRMDGGDPTGIPWQQCDVTAATTELGWHPHRDLTTSLRDLWTTSASLVPC